MKAASHWNKISVGYWDISNAALKTPSKSVNHQEVDIPVPTVPGYQEVVFLYFSRKESSDNDCRASVMIDPWPEEEGEYSYRATMTVVVAHL